MTTINGTGSGETLNGLADAANVIIGNGGSDTLTGGSAGDVIFGGGAPSSTWTGRVTFGGEQAGYRNTLGMYEVDEAGHIQNVRLVFTNASDDVLTAGQGLDVEVAHGMRVGFFILPDGFNYNSGLFEWTASAGIAHHYELRNGDGSTPGNGNVNDGPLQLYWVEHEHGWTERLRGANDFDTYHTAPAGEDGQGPSLGNALNPDGIDHALASVDENGVTTYAFEDLPAGSEHNFADLTISFGRVAPQAGPQNDDVLAGGGGDDVMWGGNGNDALDGGTGNDVLNGGSGNDLLVGAAGDDRLHGGSGDDRLSGEGTGRDHYDGGSGFDTLSFADVGDIVHLDLGKGFAQVLDPDGNLLAGHTLKSLEAAVGGSGNDRLTGSSHDDVLIGGGGGDWLRGKTGADVLTGGDGQDTFAFTKSDVRGGGVDTITDFEVGVDRLGLEDFLPGKGLKGTPWADWVRVVDGDGGTAVQVKLDGEWRDAVVLEAVHTTQLADLGL